MNVFKKIENYCIDRKNEEGKLVKIFSSFPKHIKILDVGCGYGRNIELLKVNGFENITGIEVNNKIVLKNKENGILCFNPDYFFSNFEKEEFDVILMSHIVEHFGYEELTNFLDKYLNFLKKGGSLVVVTPIMTRSFYSDFDHVKPYDPMGFNMIFSDNAQVQFYSKFKMELNDLYFRKSPIKLKNYRSLYIKKNAIPVLNRLPGGINLLLAVLFKISGGIIGHVSGWIGEYRKI